MPNPSRWAMRKDGEDNYTVFLDNGNENPVEFGGFTRDEAIEFMRNLVGDMFKHMAGLAGKN